MKSRILPFVAACLLVTAGAAHAGIDNAGTTAANFLSVGSGAGVLGMGGAVLGLGRDLNAAAWNPGALGWMGETQLVLSHSGLSDTQAQEWAAAGGRFGTLGTRWALTGLYHGQGSFEGRDATGVSTGSFNVSSTALGAQVAQNFGGRGTIGAGIKYVSEDLGSVRGSGVTFDLGAMLQAGRFGFGVAAQNLLGQMKYDGVVYEFPTNYGMGASVSIPEQGLRLALDANFPTAYYSDVRGGLEWMWRDQFALRAGYRAEMGAASGEPLAGPSFGMGAGIGGLWFDYGYLISGLGDGGEHRLGLTFRPGRLGAGSTFGHDDHSEPVVPEAREVPSASKTVKPMTQAPKPAAQRVEPPAPKPVKVEEKKDEAPVVATPPPAATPAKVETLKPSAAEPKAAPAKVETEKPDVEEPKPAPAKVEAEKPAKEAPVKIPSTYKVKDGDTLYRISVMFKTTVPKIMELNNMVNEKIQAGQTLRIPQPEQR
jgi:LysM repeat protein